MHAEEEWTARRRRGTTTAPQQSPPPSLGGRGCWQHPHGTGVSFSRSLPITGRRFNTPIRAIRRPTTMAWWRKMLACGNPEKMGYIEYRCLHCGQGKHLVAMSCKSSLCLRCAKVYVGQLGQPGEQGPPRGGHLSAHHPDGAGDVPHDLLPERGGRVERVHALRGAMPG